VRMRSHYSLDTIEAGIDAEVVLAGWVDTRRDHGGVVFIDLRDSQGLVQVVAEPDADGDTFSVAETLRGEYVISVRGRIRARPQGMINENLPTGTIEVVASAIQIRQKMQHSIRLRHEVVQFFRNYLNEQQFVDIETPILTKSTPEGARDYLVPSRTHPGQFFALPQSPQIFKQLLMVSGFDRYYQIARCFRDEDLRADRQPEFTQLDMEMSFIEEADITGLMENMMRELFKSVLDTALPDPFPRMSWQEAMDRYGSDRPDLRIHLELTELTDIMKSAEFKVFSGPANNPDGRVAALAIPGGADLTRQTIDQYTEFAKSLGAGGLAYIKVNDVSAGSNGLQSPIIKFLDEATIAELMKRTGSTDGDIIFFGADRRSIVDDVLGALRVRIASERGMVADEWQPLWVEDFPLVEWDEDNKRFSAMHHPFTSPRIDHLDLLDSDPGKVLARAYDLVLNGSELGGGSIRIHDNEVQQKVFAALGIGTDEAQSKFGFLLDALRYGAPPHGGIAMGIDRIAAIMAGADSIRDVIAFPKTQRASCLLTDAPSGADSAQLRELGIRLRQNVQAQQAQADAESSGDSTD